MQQINVEKRARKIMSELKQNNPSAYEDLCPAATVIPEPKIGTGNIKIIIIGQDPTIKNEHRREKITQVLNLNKNGALLTYISDIVKQLSCDINENIYATNLLKCFFKHPPASKDNNIIEKHTPYWLGLLKEEISQYPNALIITLGEPLLKALTKDELKKSAKVRNYWGYNNYIKKEEQQFNYCSAAENKLNRDFFPFPHQPSRYKEFYKNTFNNYLKFVLKNSNIRNQ